jgi:hypothetical protein
MTQGPGGGEVGRTGRIPNPFKDLKAPRVWRIFLFPMHKIVVKDKKLS